MKRKTTAKAHPAVTLKAVRLEQGLSLRELSARVGMPYSTLSKLENGKMAMTYDKLFSLAQGLGVDLASLVAGEPPSTRQAAVGRRSVSRAGEWLEAISARDADRYPASDLLGKMMVPAIIDVTARSVEEIGGLIRHAGEEYLYVLAGRMELHSDLYEPLAMAKGDSIYFDSGMAHAYVHVGDEPCQILAVCAGPGIQRFLKFARAEPEES